MNIIIRQFIEIIKLRLNRTDQRIFCITALFVGGAL
nr:MAG TPA: hypothetical protein [Caudoviricetes sp.]